MSEGIKTEQWQSKMPTEPGFYWFTDGDWLKVCEVYDGAAHFTNGARISYYRKGDLYSERIVEPTANGPKGDWREQYSCYPKPCAYPGPGKEYRCDDESGSKFPSHCHCSCHKE